MEVSVLIAQRWVLAALRHRTFFTLADLNAAIGERIDGINDRPMNITGVSRRVLFEQLDRPALIGGRFATQLDHMPRAHRAHAEWTPSRLIAWAAQTGPATGRLVAGLLERRPHPEQGYRACLGLMRLGRVHGADRLDAACHRAERLGSYRYRTVEHILLHQQDRLPLEELAPARPALTHENLRGAASYEEAYADAPHDREAPGPAPARDGHGV